MPGASSLVVDDVHLDTSFGGRSSRARIDRDVGAVRAARRQSQLVASIQLVLRSMRCRFCSSCGFRCGGRTAGSGVSAAECAELVRVDVLGYSFGGALAQKLARDCSAPQARYATVTSSYAVPGWSGLPWLHGFHNEAVRVRENDPSVPVLNGPPARRSPAKMRLHVHQRRRTPIFALTSRNVVGAINAFLAAD